MRATIQNTDPGLSDADKLAADMAGLIEGFRLTKGFMTANTLGVFAQHHDASTLCNLGLIRSGMHDRWTSGYYPAGQLKAELDLRQVKL